MLNFPCLCGEKFSLGDEMAGESFQCKKCGRLVIVPTLDDLQSIGADGTYDIDTVSPPPQHIQLQPLTDDQKPPAASPAESAEAYDVQPAARIAPRYDPFTGELIREHEVVVKPDTAESKKAVHLQPLSKSKYRGELASAPPMAWLYAFGQLCMARSMAVLIAMTFLHTLAVMVAFFVVAIGFFLMIFIPVVIFFVCAGYYSLVVQETGPECKDELPTPLRNFDFRTDMFDPFVHLILSILVCFAPAAFVYVKFSGNPVGTWLGNVLAVAGAIVFPAFFLTLAVDGIIANLRPDRLLGVIRRAGLAYIPVVIAWTLGTILLFVGVIGMLLAPRYMFTSPDTSIPQPRFVPDGTISFFLVWGGLYLSYYACWVLGLIWRKHHREFPWIAQRFTKPPPLPAAGEGRGPTPV